jgi:hypothetical protein
VQREAVVLLLVAIAACDRTGLTPTTLRVTSGRIESRGAGHVLVEVPGLRARSASERPARSAEVAFTYMGPTRETAPLASGELRRQIGLSLRAQDTCNVVYVMWHVEPDPGVAVSVKANPGQATHEACGASGYVNLPRSTTARAPAIRVGEPHRLRADLDGRALRVLADDVVAWEGALPDVAMRFDGPAGVRTDNGVFDLELRE